MPRQTINLDGTALENANATILCVLILEPVTMLRQFLDIER